MGIANNERRSGLLARMLDEDAWPNLKPQVSAGFARYFEVLYPNLRSPEARDRPGGARDGQQFSDSAYGSEQSRV